MLPGIGRLNCVCVWCVSCLRLHIAHIFRREICVAENLFFLLWKQAKIVEEKKKMKKHKQPIHTRTQTSCIEHRERERKRLKPVAFNQKRVRMQNVCWVRYPVLELMSIGYLKKREKREIERNGNTQADQPISVSSIVQTLIVILHSTICHGSPI